MTKALQPCISEEDAMIRTNLRETNPLDRTLFHLGRVVTTQHQLVAPLRPLTEPFPRHLGGH